MRAILLIGVLLQSLAQPGNPFVGEWVFDPVRSQIHGGLRAKFDMGEQSLHYTTEAIEFTARFDGNEYPIRGLAVAASVIVRRVDRNTIERTYKRDGTIRSMTTLTVSPDGRFMKVQSTLASRQGAAQSRREHIYERLSALPITDPFDGEWERNPSRRIGNSIDRIAFKTKGNGNLNLRADRVEYSATPDGRTCDVRGTLIANHESMQRTGNRRIDETWKADGQEVAHISRSISEGETEMTVVVSGVTTNGDPFENIFFYRRQR